MSDHVRIYDTTLRYLNVDISEKIHVAHRLTRMGVDIIEAGFPVASNEDFDSVYAIADNVRGPIISALARIVLKDIDRAAEALMPTEHDMIHLFSMGSDANIKEIMHISREENIRRSVEAVEYACSRFDNVQFSAQDATRSDRGYLVELYTAVAEAGAKTLNISDTYGRASTIEYEALVKHLIQNVEPPEPGVVFSASCLNTLNLAITNSIAAVYAGCRQVACSLNGLEDTCTLESFVKALHAESKRLGVPTKIILSQEDNSSNLLSVY